MFVTEYQVIHLHYRTLPHYCTGAIIHIQYFIFLLVISSLPALRNKPEYTPLPKSNFNSLSLQIMLQQMAKINLIKKKRIYLNLFQRCNIFNYRATADILQVAVHVARIERVKCTCLLL